MKLNVQVYLKCWLWHLASLPWVEHKFNYGITGMWQAAKILTAMLILGARVRRQTDENIEAVVTTRFCPGAGVVQRRPLVT